MLQLFIGGELSKRKLERLRRLLSVELDRPLEVTDKGSLIDPGIERPEWLFIEKRGGALYVEATDRFNLSEALKMGLRTLKLPYSAILSEDNKTCILHGRPSAMRGWDETFDEAIVDGEPMISADDVRQAVVRACGSLEAGRLARSVLSDLVADLSRILPAHSIADLPEFRVAKEARFSL